MKWTEEQWDAITEKDCNLLVAAAAGAGKTAVLVERIIRKITDPKDPVDIDRLLIVTFTNAAAAEMRERIAVAILKVLDEQPHNKNVQRQLTLLNKANIMTIHSFCLEVIRSNFQLVDLDPSFRIADATEASLMQLEVLSELFEDQYEEEEIPQDFIDLLESYSGNRDDQGLQNIVLELYKFVQSSPWPKKWLQEMAAGFTVPEGTDVSEFPWGQVLLENAAVELRGLKVQMDKAIALLNEDNGLEKYREVFVEDVAGLDTLLGLCSPCGVSEAPDGSSGMRKLPQDRGENSETANVVAFQGADDSSLCSRGAWDAIWEVLGRYNFSRLPSIRKSDNPDKVKQDYVKKIRDTVKKEIKGMQENVFTAPSAEVIEDLAYLAPMMECLARLIADFGSRYRGKKSKKGLLDFNDLEHLSLEILAQEDEDGKLVPSEVAAGYRERFAEIMVDEYQDSNLVQEMLLNMISRESVGKPNMFMVGDVKQSIYRFRQARPELFLEKYHTYPSEKGQLYRKILLFKNFRSRKEVVDGINFVFKQIMSSHVGELEYSDIEALNPGAQYPEPEEGQVLLGGGMELHLLETEKDAGEIGAGSGESGDAGGSEAEFGASDALGKGVGVGEDWEEFNGGPEEEAELVDNIQLEARLVARRIQELRQPVAAGKGQVQGKGSENGSESETVAEAEAETDSEAENSAQPESLRYRCVYDKELKVYRRIQYRDIVILLRTTKKWSEVFMEELKLQGIPAFADTGSGFFATPEVQVVLSLLQIIDNPLQDIPLLAVLRSPIVNFSTEELAQVRLADRRALLYDALVVLAQDGSGSASEKAEDFLANLERWRDMSRYMSTDQLLWQLYSETGYYSMVGAMPAGEQRQANLRILFQRARQFETTSYKGLFNFIFFVDKLKTSQGDMGSAKILGENDNVVRIMSIHKSKGLEFPIVILAGCGKQFNLQDMNKKIVVHQDLGLGPNVVDHKNRLVYPSVPKEAIRQKIKIETLSEEMRILYVAMTRAKERLIITGTLKDVGKAATKWAQSTQTKETMLPGYEIQRGKGFLDWIGLSVLRHPDGAVLREIAETESFDAYLLAEESQWEIKIWNRKEVLTGFQGEQDEAPPFSWLENVLAAGENVEAGENIAAASEKLGELRGDSTDIAAGGDFPEEVTVHEDLACDASECEDTLEALGSELSREVDRRLSWQYAYVQASKLPVKVSVTELKRQAETEFSGEEATAAAGFLGDSMKLVKRPGFLEEKQGLTPAEVGTAMHLVMQHLDFAPDADSIQEQVAAMVTKAMLTQEQAQSIAIEKIRGFLSSALGKRLREAKSIKREMPFNLALPCHEVAQDFQGEAYQEETVLLQGVIDCFFEEEDGIVLLDYKTDYVPQGQSEIIKERYRLQISYYTRALETLTGKTVKDKYIYLFYNGEILEY